MPIYEYKCSCSREKEVICSMKDSDKPVVCECGQEMCKIFSVPYTDLVERVRLSNSMGCNPRRIQENMRRYPGSEYTPDGRLIVNSRKDKLKKMKERGLTEFE